MAAMKRLATATFLTIAAICLTGSAAAAAPASGNAADGEPSWDTYAAQVSAVHRGPDANTLLLDAEVRGGGETCARDARADQLEESGDAIWANVVYDTDTANPDCAGWQTLSVTLTAQSPIGDRTIVLNHEQWAPGASGYHRCDSELGCNPPGDHCDQRWIDAAISRMDIPRHSGWSVEHCGDPWLVVSIDVNAGACGPEGGRPGCEAPPNVSRYFLRFGEWGWSTRTQTKSAGCDAVLAVEPTFPREVCEGLPVPS